MSFLPADYKSPNANNNYMKLVEGENKIRILTSPILGWEDWENNRPIRFRMEDKPLKSIDPKKPIRHFWAFVVFNYATEEIQILHIVQATLRKQIQMLCDDADWGSPFFYDIKIIKQGKSISTEYMVNALPHKPTADYIINQFNEKPCNLEALFDSADPFDKKWDTFTQGVFKRNDEVIKKPETKERSSVALISKAQADELEDAYNDCSDDYKKSLMASLKKDPINVTDLSKLPVTLYDKVKTAIIKNRDEYQATLNKKDQELPF